MEDWQRDYDLGQLRTFAAPFKERHKALVFGAFGLTKERDIADALYLKRAIWTGNPPRAVALFAVAKVSHEQHDFAQRAFAIPAGAVAVKAFAALDAEAGIKVLDSLVTRARGQLWVEIFEEDDVARDAVGRAGFEYVATKVSAGSEIKGVYRHAAGPAPLPPLSDADRATLVVVDHKFLSEKEHRAIVAELADDSHWAQHYSSYNKRKSWEAFALRGFDDDPEFIIKPAEMSKAWKEDNVGRLKARPRMTTAAGHFPATLKAAARLAPLEHCDRIRFMRLKAKDGELARHADITDREAGTADGMICRFHVPIITSPAVLVSGWTERGERIDGCFPEKALCYLDVRKPHTVVNADPTLARVHLVIDCHGSPAIRARLSAATRIKAAA